jgi:hypothetical protein
LSAGSRDLAHCGDPRTDEVMSGITVLAVVVYRVRDGLIHDVVFLM